MLGQTKHEEIIKDLVCASKVIKQHKMECISEFIPFAKEMLRERPSRSMLKIYMIGSTVAMLGMVGGLVETIVLPFVEKDPFEDEPLELVMENETKKKQVLNSQPPLVHTEVVEVPEALAIGAKAKHLVTAGRRNSANRLHAS
ncbi:G0/G1 switch protein 2 [Acanthochromis polyacanthus]|uniref:G0/G1 switch protein 2-like n=1 Tax=Acanthochromis polyacanthus TaxID=80966 RepID=A0A3Q1G197_9TELE|nr:G0/G1 switch protein 2 [Acanthochromis polyacanthus]